MYSPLIDPMYIGYDIKLQSGPLLNKAQHLGFFKIYKFGAHYHMMKPKYYWFNAISFKTSRRHNTQFHYSKYKVFGELLLIISANFCKHQVFIKKNVSNKPMTRPLLRFMFSLRHFLKNSQKSMFNQTLFRSQALLYWPRRVEKNIECGILLLQDERP